MKKLTVLVGCLFIMMITSAHAVVSFECLSNDDCNDYNECTSDICAAESCINEPLENGSQCDDGLYCTDIDSCFNGECVGTFRNCVCNEELNICIDDNDNDFCKGNFDFDKDVDGSDAALFKAHFGRSTFQNPCPPDGPAPVEKTWQTTSYATGDDGEHQSGVPFPEPRFVDNEDGTVTDNLTGLIWTKNANLDGLVTWNDALVYIEQMNEGTYSNYGFTDWRLPNMKEFLSLVDYDNYIPSLPSGHPFDNVVIDYNQSFYWTSSTNVEVNTQAWCVRMYIPDVWSYNKISYQYPFWPVRGGH